jgi:hypothetical protein
MTPPAIKSLMTEKLSATRRSDKGKLIKLCQELGEWFMLHNRYQEAINEYIDLVSFQEVKYIYIRLFTFLK